MIQGLNYNKGKRFSLLQEAQNGSGAQPVSYGTGTGVLSRGHKRDHSPQTIDEVKKQYSYTSTPPIMPLWHLNYSELCLPILKVQVVLLPFYSTLRYAELVE
jgi:hypothetical protein